MDLNVDDLDFDPNNEHPARHGISEREIIQVWQNDPRFFRNKEARSAEYLMVGRTFGGRLLSVALAETPTAGVYRPVTAFDSPAEHRLRYRRAGGE